MPAISTESPAQMRARLARASRRAKRTDDPTDRAEVRRLQSEYAADRLADYVRQVVANAPPLTEAQRDSIAALLRPSAGGGPSAA